MSSMLTEGGSAPAAVPVVRGRHRAPRPKVQGRFATTWPLVGSLIARTVTTPAEAHTSSHSTPPRVQPAPGLHADSTSASRAALAVSGRDAGVLECVVTAGETVADIAARYNVSTASVLALNGLSWRTPIDAGAVLLVRPGTHPSSNLTMQPDAIVHHPVAEGDTVSTIAAGHGVATAAILLANGLSRSSALTPGQRLVIPRPIRTMPDSQTGESLALTGEMRWNASIIVATGRTQGVADDGVVAALAAAMQDSALRNLDLEQQDTGGLFQRRPGSGWGSPRQVMDPSHASRAFFGGPGSPVRDSARGLLDVPGWQLMTVGEAASIVQESGTASAYGKWERNAREWLRQLDRAN